MPELAAGVMRISADDDDQVDQQHELADPERPFSARYIHKDSGITASVLWTNMIWDGLGRLAAWHLPGGPVGPPTRWAATSNVEVSK